MKLVDRFIGFIDWPVSRKTLLFSSLSMLATLLISQVWDISLLPSLRVSLLHPYLLLWSLMFLCTTLISLPSAWAGRDARWTAYVMVLADAPFIVGFVYLFGTMSTPFVAFFPTIVTMWAIYFDERIAWCGFASILTGFIVVGLLEHFGGLPYAPILLERSMDAQVSSSWFNAMMFATLDLFFFCFSLCLLVLSARRMQDRQLNQTHESLKRVNQLISRYVPAQVSERLCLLPGDSESAKPERRRLTILYSDIQGFTHASDELDAEELVGILNEYLSEMMVIADSYGGTVSQMMGDGIMIIFGAPTATHDKDHALRAVNMSLKMQDRMSQLQRIWFLRGYQHPFGIRIGINTGVASVGDFGSEGRKIYSAVGVHANLAMRIQTYCEPGRVLVSESTAELIADDFRNAFRCHIPVKQLAEPVAVYEVQTDALRQNQS